MVDFQFAEPSLAALYDLFCPWDPRGDSGFYLPLVMAAESVLDVGCGTGMLLRRARAEGHPGRLCGLDPAAAMLDVAQAGTGSGIDWVLGDLSSVRWQEKFDLIVMTGHAFQVLTGDEQLREALAAVQAVLGPGGRFAFETRNPLVRQWEHWVPRERAGDHRSRRDRGADGAAGRAAGRGRSCLVHVHVLVSELGTTAGQPQRAALPYR